MCHVLLAVIALTLHPLPLLSADPPKTDPDGLPIIGDVYPGSATKGYDFKYQSYRTYGSLLLRGDFQEGGRIPVDWRDEHRRTLLAMCGSRG